MLCDRGGAAVRVQSGGTGRRGLDFQHLTSDCRYVHRQHRVGTLKALSAGALELRGPTIFPEVSWEEKLFYEGLRTDIHFMCSVLSIQIDR